MSGDLGTTEQIDDAPDENPQVPDNCLIIECRDGYRVEFEAEATRVASDDPDAVQYTNSKGGFRVWLTLFDGEKQCSSADVVVESMDQWTFKALAVGYAEGWDRG